MADPKIERTEGATPAVPLATALELASRRAGRSADEIRIAIYHSAMELEAAAAEDPTSPRSVRRWEPHWSILFAREEGIIDVGHGPGYAFLDGEGVLVFDDGSTTTSEENEAPN